MMGKILSFVLNQESDPNEEKVISKSKSWQEIEDEYKAELCNEEDYEPTLYIDDIIFY